MKHEYKIKYANVELRQLEEDDLEHLRVWRNNLGNTKYLRKIPYITRDIQKKWYEQYLQDEEEMTFAIIENDDLCRIVGSLSLYNFSEERVEFGKILIGDPEAHGRSIGTNALKAVLSIVFNQLKMESVYLHVYKENKIAINSYEKAGFKIEEIHNTQNGTEYLMYIQKKDFS